MATVKPWIRLYTEVPADPKVQRLTDKMFRFWVNCLCLAGKYDGNLPSDEDISWILRVDLPTVKERLAALVDAELLDINEDNRFVPHGWAHRQYESDLSTDRVKRFRKRSMKRDETVSETAPEQSRTEQIQNRTDTEQSATSNLSARYTQFIADWTKPTEDGRRFTCADVDLGCQVWMSLIDKGTITESNVGEIFAGLERHRQSKKWNEGFVLSVPAFLGWAKNGTPAAPRWNDRPEPHSDGGY